MQTINKVEKPRLSSTKNSKTKTMASNNHGDDEINLRTLKRIIPDVSEIIINGGQVAVYRYNEGEWEKKEIEGSLFVARRGVGKVSQFVLIVVNRLNTNNMVHHVTHNFDTKLQTPYIMYKTKDNDILCVWFYGTEDCMRVAVKLQEIVSQSQKDHQIIDLIESGSFLNVRSPNMRANEGGAGRDNGQEMFQRLLSRDGVANNGAAVHGHANNHHNLTQVNALNGDERQQLKQQKISIQDLFMSGSAGHQSQGDLVTKLSLATRVNLSKDKDEDLLVNNYVHATQTPIQKTQPSQVQTSNLIDISSSQPVQEQQASLIEQQHQQSNNHLNSTPAFAQFASLVPQFANQTISHSPNHNDMASLTPNKPITALTMEQLKQTMIHLLQTDADFLHTIHDTYMKSIQKRN